MGKEKPDGAMTCNDDARRRASSNTYPRRTCHKRSLRSRGELRARRRARRGKEPCGGFYGLVPSPECKNSNVCTNLPTPLNKQKGQSPGKASGPRRGKSWLRWYHGLLPQSDGANGFGDYVTVL